MSSQQILIDSSIWIKSFRGELDKGSLKLISNAIEDSNCVILPQIIMELLQGAKNPKEYSALKKQFESLIVDYVAEVDWEKIYSLAYSLRRKGYIIPTIDILIASRAIEKKYFLLHCDKHFQIISKHSKLEEAYL